MMNMPSSRLALLSIAAALVTECSASEPGLLKRDEDESNGPIAGYKPLIAPAVVALSLYLLVGAVMIAHWKRHGQRYMLIIAAGMGCMATGFVLRLVYINQLFSIGLFAIEELFLIGTPCLFLAGIYMITTRFMDHVGQRVHEHCLFLKKRWIVRGFVVMDVVTFLVQAGGSGLTAVNKPSVASTGKNITLAGLIIQLVAFLVFVSLVVVFLLRVRRDFPALWNRGGSKSLFPAFTSGTQLLDWRVLFATLLFSSTAILVRSVFRTIEYSQGWHGFLRTHEVFLYTLDTLPLWLAMTVFVCAWPPLYMPTSEQGVYELEKEPSGSSQQQA